MDKFLETIAEPLANLMRAAADWLDAQSEPIDLPELDEPTKPEPMWQMNARGGFDPIGR